MPCECPPSGLFVCFSFKKDLDLFTYMGETGFWFLRGRHAFVCVQHTLLKMIQPFFSFFFPLKGVPNKELISEVRAFCLGVNGLQTTDHTLSGFDLPKMLQVVSL